MAASVKEAFGLEISMAEDRIRGKEPVPETVQMADGWIDHRP